MAGPVRVGLIGCGRIARVHRSYLAALPGVEVIGAWDLDPGARAAFAAEFRVAGFESCEQLIERGRPDVVHVLTPPAAHAPVAMLALQAGVSVLVEKPLAVDAAEAERLVAAARRAGRWISVDHNRWFDPVVQRAAALLSSGRLGRFVGVDVFQGADADAAGDVGWKAGLPGGLLHNLASHPLYLMRRFAGPVRDLRVVAATSAEGALEEVRLVARGENGPASVGMSLRARPSSNRLVVYGTEASVEANLNNMTLIERRPRRLPKVLGKVWPNLSEAAQLLSATVRNGAAFAAGRQRYYPGIGAHLRLLYENVAAGKPPPVEAEEGLDVACWYDEILRQAGLARRTGTEPATS